jgi:hypothetical protein
MRQGERKRKDKEREKIMKSKWRMEEKGRERDD